MKIIILILFALIIYSLGSGLFYLVSGQADKQRMAKALTWRIGLSLFLFALLFVAFGLGWIKPHGL